MLKVNCYVNSDSDLIGNKASDCILLGCADFIEVHKEEDMHCLILRQKGYNVSHL